MPPLRAAAVAWGVRYEPESLSLRFDDAAELDRFHAELGALLRRVVLSGAVRGEEASVGVERAREALLAADTVVRALATLRARPAGEGGTSGPG